MLNWCDTPIFVACIIDKSVFRFESNIKSCEGYDKRNGILDVNSFCLVEGLEKNASMVIVFNLAYSNILIVSISYILSRSSAK